MSTVTSGLDAISQDWVQKFHFDNKVDLSLQSTGKDESGKIEIDEIPTQIPQVSSGTNTKTSATDSYLQSILSSTNSTSGTTTTTAPSSITTACTNSPTCSCFKCQRQRRRAGINKITGSSNVPNITTRKTSIDNNSNNDDNNNINGTSKSSSFYSTTSTVKTTTSASTSTSVPSPSSTIKTPSPQSSVTNIHSISNPVSPPTTPIPSPQQMPKRANTLRKTPTLRSYEKHMPKPTYSQDDSIYRINDPKPNSRSESSTDDDRNKSHSDQYNKEGYKISWKEDETGDDILPSLVTFHTIFEEKGDDSPDGLSDLLEQRARQLRDQKLRQQEEALFPKQRQIPELPPRLKECLTLSYRSGPKHNALTLYHTMKMQTQKERLQAYELAFRHCVNAQSGLKDFVKKERKAPIRESSKLIQPVKRPMANTKRSLLHPLGGSRKNKLLGEHDLIWSASSDNLVPLQKKSIEISAPILMSAAPTDVVAATQALVPNAYLNNDSQSNNSSKPYEYIDTPSRPRATDAPNLKDTSSISSTESYNKGKRPNRLFSSLGRKTSVKSQQSSIKATSIKSIDNNSEHERVLDELCRILPHIDRQSLSPYVVEANNDYMAALQLCRAAVMSGKLT